MSAISKQLALRHEFLMVAIHTARTHHYVPLGFRIPAILDEQVAATF